MSLCCRFGVLLNLRDSQGSDREQTVALLDSNGAEPGQYQLGLTKVSAELHQRFSDEVDSVSCYVSFKD